jgi:hypothetical protein
MSENVTVVTDLPVKPRSQKLKTLAGAAVVITTVAIAIKVRSALQSGSTEETVNTTDTPAA